MGLVYRSVTGQGNNMINQSNVTILLIRTFWTDAYLGGFNTILPCLLGYTPSAKSRLN